MSTANSLFYVHLLRDSLLLSKGVSVLETEMFMRPGEEAFALLWDITKNWYLQYMGEVIRPDVLIHEVNKRIQADPTIEAGSRLVTDVQTFITHIYNINPLGPNEQDSMINDLRALVDDRVIRDKLADVQSASGGQDFSQKYNELTALREQYAISQTSNVDMMYANKGIDCSRTPTGFRPIDNMIGGGIMDGEVYGYIGSTSGGKSTLALQLALSLIENSRVATGFITYEMSLFPMYHHRIISYHTGLSTTTLKEWKVATPDDIRDEAIRKDFVEWWKDLIEPNFHIQQRVGDMNGVAGVQEEVIQARREKKEIKFMVLDQHKQFVEGIRRAGNDREEFQTISQRVPMQLIALGESMGFATWLPHQKKSALKGDPPTKIPAQGEGQDDNGFENWCSYGIGQSNLSNSSHDCPEEGLCVISNPKKRDSGHMVSVMQLDGPGSKFIDASTKYELSNGEFVPLSENVFGGRPQN